MRECESCQKCFEDTVPVCPLDGATLLDRFVGSATIDGKYRLERRLGQGGMGAVYLALHVGLQRRFAIKLVHPALASSPAFAERFRLEARALGRLKHPNIVEVTDYGTDTRGDGLHYLVMEHLDGETLADFATVRGALSPVDALPLLETLAAALDYAHRQGVLHRDLKPANVFLDRQSSKTDGEITLKVMDFGIAKLIGDADLFVPPSELVAMPSIQTLALGPGGEGAPTGTIAPTPVSSLAYPITARGEVLGTPPYMAPEVIRSGHPTPASDVYAFGVIAYELLTRRVPFTGDTATVLRAHVDMAPAKPSAVAGTEPLLDAAVLAPLAKSPTDRPPSATEAYRLLRDAWDHAQRRTWLAKELPRRLALSVLLAGVAVFLAGALSRLDLARRVEGWTIDTRFSALRPRAPDPRIVLVVMDEASLASDSTSLAQKADEFGEVLEQIFAAGARRVGVDFVLPDSWRDSRAFASLVMRHADALTLAAFSASNGEVIGAGCLGGLVSVALGPERASSLLAFVNLDEDADGVTRRAWRTLGDSEGAQRDAWASRLAGGQSVASPFWIDHSVDWRLLPRISWRDLPAKLRDEPSLASGRLVLVGGEFAASGDDYHRVPRRLGADAAVSGLVVQALIANTILGEYPFRDAPRVAERGFAWLIGFALLLGTLLTRGIRPPLLLGGGGLLFVVATAGVAMQSGWIVGVTALLLAGAVGLVAGLFLRRWLPPFPSPSPQTRTDS